MPSVLDIARYNPSKSVYRIFPHELFQYGYYASTGYLESGVYKRQLSMNESDLFWNSDVMWVLLLGNRLTAWPDFRQLFEGMTTAFFSTLHYEMPGITSRIDLVTRWNTRVQTPDGMRYFAWQTNFEESPYVQSLSDKDSYFFLLTGKAPVISVSDYASYIKENPLARARTRNTTPQGQAKR